MSNKETALKHLFGDHIAKDLEQKIVQAKETRERIEIIESFLLGCLTSKSTIDRIIETTIDALVSSSGSISINYIVKNEQSKRRQLERKFSKHVGISPKQLGKIIRLQAALKMLLSNKTGKLTNIAYGSEYYDQAHFIRDFKEFTGTSPSEFLQSENMTLSSLIYKKD